MAPGKKDNREAELEAVIEKIKHQVWKPGQTLPALRKAIALILQGLKPPAENCHLVEAVTETRHMKH